MLRATRECGVTFCDVKLQGIVDTVTDPLLVLDSALCVVAASRSFFDTFRIDPDDTIGSPISELGNGQWDIPELRRLLLDVIPKATAVINYEVEHEFPDLGRRTMLVTARTLHRPGGGGHLSVNQLALSEKRCRKQMTKLLRVSWLSPRIVEAITSGMHPKCITRTQLLAIELPTDGAEQERALGIAA